MTKIWGFGHGFWRAQTGPPAQRQLVRGLAVASSQDPQRGPKWSKYGQIWGPSRSLQGPSGQREQIGTFWPGTKSCAQRAQNGQKMTKIDFSQDAKSGQNDQNLRFWAWVFEVLSRSSSPKAARKGSSRSLPPGPSKGVQNDQK